MPEAPPAWGEAGAGAVGGDRARAGKALAKETARPAALRGAAAPGAGGAPGAAPRPPRKVYRHHRSFHYTVLDLGLGPGGVSGEDGTAAPPSLAGAKAPPPQGSNRFS